MMKPARDWAASISAEKQRNYTPQAGFEKKLLAKLERVNPAAELEGRTSAAPQIQSPPRKKHRRMTMPMPKQSEQPLKGLDYFRKAAEAFSKQPLPTYEERVAQFERSKKQFPIPSSPSGDASKGIGGK